MRSMSKSSEQYVLGLILARGGSKGVPQKNVRMLAGKPLIRYTCQAAAQSHRIRRTIISTDSPEIAEQARLGGVEVPFMRPAELAADNSPAIDAVRHAIGWLAQNESRQPDVIVLLQPTSPLRQARHIDEAVGLLLRGDADSLVSVTAVPKHFSPHWQLAVDDGRLNLVTGQPLKHIVPRRQELPTTYYRNGAVYAFWRESFERTGSFYGDSSLAYVMPAEVSVNIDTLDDWHNAELQLLTRTSRNHEEPLSLLAILRSA